MSHRGDPRLPTADQIERHGLKHWAHRLVLRLYDRFREIDNDLWDNPALNGLSEVTPAADTFAYFDSTTTATTTGLTSAARTLLDDTNVGVMRSTLGVDAALTTGSWTPTFTFATPGDLSVSYSGRTGKYTVLNNRVDLFFSIVTSSFTHTTASGDAKITGIPFDSDAAINYESGVRFNGITKATYTDFYCSIAPTSPSFIIFPASGSGVSTATVTASDMPTGGLIVLIGQLTYLK